MPIRRRIELSVNEARLRFQQLVRVTALTGQVTVVVDGGRPIAAIVPATDLTDVPAPPPGMTHPAPPPQPPGVAHPSPPAPRQPADSVRPPGRSSADRTPGAGHPPGGGHPPGAGHPLGGGHPSAAPAVVSKPPGESGAGWLRRIEKVREDVRRQHAGRIDELARALEEAWQLLDAARPPGTDRHIDVTRAAHADLRRSR